MYDVNDTIVAVASPTSDQRVIIRISGPETKKITSCLTRNTQYPTRNTIQAANLIIDDELEIESQVYFFLSPHSYTGDDLAEIHLYTNPAVTASVIDKLLKAGCRTAEPGEFTARAYLNGKIDLAQAEAVNEIIVSSNTLQLAAAEKLLKGRLSQKSAGICTEIMETMSLIEAGLDFSGENIEFITRQKAIERLTGIKKQLEELLAGSINYEAIIDLPSAGIAGAPGAGKSSLLNRLTGTERSIVSNQHKTTRDVLTSLMQLAHCRCVLFDCAGLLTEHDPDLSGLDELSQQAAIEALRNSNLVLFCVDLSKEDWTEDISIHKLIPMNIGTKISIPVATKCDLISERDAGCVPMYNGIFFAHAVQNDSQGEKMQGVQLKDKLHTLQELFGVEFNPISSKTGAGIDSLLKTIDMKLIGPDVIGRTILTARHKKAVTEAIENVSESMEELTIGNDEITAMMLRAAYQALSAIPMYIGTGGHIDEQILELIFNRFCIGK